MSPARVRYEHPRRSRQKHVNSSAPSQPCLPPDSYDYDEDIFAPGKNFAVVIHSPSSSQRSSQPQPRSFMGTATSSVTKKNRSKKEVYRVSDSSSSEEPRRPKTPEPRKKPRFLEESDSPLESPPQAILKNGVAYTPKKSPTEAPPNRKNVAVGNFITDGYLVPVSKAANGSSRSRPSRATGKMFHSPKQKGVITLSSDKESDSRSDEDSGDMLVGHKKPAHLALRTESDDDESDEVVELHSSARRKRLATRQKKEDWSADKEPHKVQNHMKRRRFSSSDDDDEPIRSSPVKRRKQIQISESTPMQDKRLTRRADTPRRHRTEKEKKLELLRRRRAGEKINELTESSSQEERGKGVYDTDSDLEVLDVFEDEESEEGIEEVRRSLRPNNRDDNDDSFVVEDDDEFLGVHSDLHDIPLEFTHQAHKPLKDHFKDAVEWMVQGKINPSFNRRDPIYIQAFRKLEPEARGLAQSKFSSAVWSETFTRALWARPAFHEEEIGIGDEAEGRKCDACGRRKYPVRFKVQLRGRAYSQNTLEEIDNEQNDSDPEASDDSKSVNSKGQDIPSEDKDYYLGRFCRANAERAHSLIHWKHALNEWVVQTLEDQGFLEPEKLAERIKWNQRKLSALANEIVDEWVDKGEIKSLYRDFKNNIETARNAKQGRWNP